MVGPPPLTFTLCGNAQASPLGVEGAPQPNDARIVAWVDPNLKWSSYPGGLYLFQGGGGEHRDISEFREPGYLDPKSHQHLLMRVADPDGTGCAIRHYSLKGQDYYMNRGPSCAITDASGDSECATARSSILCRWGEDSPTCHKAGGSYWAVWAVWIGPDYEGDTTGAAINSYGHSVTSGNWLSLLAMGHSDSNFQLWTSYNPVLDEKTPKGGGKPGALHEVDILRATLPAPKGVWHYFVRQYKFGYAPSQEPYYRVWHAIGEGQAQQVVNTNDPNAFNESAGFHPWKFGNYQWCVTDGTNSTRDCWGRNKSRTLYTKGIYIFRDVPGPTPLNVDTLLTLIRSR